MEYRKDLPSSTMFDLIQFINLFNTPGIRRRMLRMTFDELKHCWVTIDGVTIWQLSNEVVKKQPAHDAIGNDDIAPQAFFIELAIELAKTNPRLKNIIALIKEPPEQMLMQNAGL